MSQLNPYTVLNVPESATAEEIKKSYRKLSLQWHPDRNKNSPESTTKFQELNAAYEMIGDDDKRRNYDMQRRSPFHGGGSDGMAFSVNGMPFGGMSFENIHINPADILNFFTSSVFETGAPASSHSTTHSSMPSASFPFQFDKNTMHCGGGGGGNTNNSRSGQFFNLNNIKQKLAKPTPIIIKETIDLCKSYTGHSMPITITRWIIENDLKREETETLYIQIPKGIDNNEIIVLSEKGNIISETNKGDVKVFIRVTNDTEFTRDGLDLHITKNISLKDALCGFSFDLIFVDGRVFKINNNRGSIITHNYIKVLSNMGMIRENNTGNLIITFKVLFPEKLSLQQIETIVNVL